MSPRIGLPVLKLPQLRNESGAIDLASIMVGVVVTGVVASAISSTVFAAIPWAQNEAAKSSLQAVSMAQSVAHVQTGKYSTIPELVADGYLPKGTESLGASGPALPAAAKGFAMKAATPAGEPKLIVDVGTNASCFAAVIESEAGAVFWLDNANPKPQLLDKKSSSSLCADLTDMASELPSVKAEASIMKLTVDASIPGCQTYALPISGLTGEVRVDWNDGSAPEAVSGNQPKHNFSSAKSYDVSIDGKFSGFGAMGSAMDTECITSVTRWDEATGTKSLAFAFYNSPITTLAAPPSTVTDMSSMFSGAAKFNQPINFSTRKVTSMHGMFENASAFNQSLGDEFDTSNVTHMMSMFNGATSFNQDLGKKFNTSNVKYMSTMFANAYKFNGSLGNQFNTSRVVTMSNMFAGTGAFTQGLGDKFDTSNVTDMTRMFNGSAFNSSLGQKFDTSKVENMSYMFTAAKFNQPLGDKFDTSSVTSMYEMFSTASFNQPLGEKFDTSNVTSFSRLFSNNLVFNQSLGNKFDTSNATNMSDMFTNAKAFNQPLGDKFNTSNVTTMSSMFYGASMFNQPLGDKFDTSKVTNMNEMFRKATVFSQDLSGWDVSLISRAPVKFGTESALTADQLPHWASS